MRVRAQFYGALRARLGLDGRWLDLEPGSRALDAARAACGHLGPCWPAALSFAVNGEFVPGATALRAGDQVDLLPPVSGGAPEVQAAADRFLVTREPLDLGSLLAGLDDPSCGGLAVFVGRVRREQEGRAVSSLDYEAHEALALKEFGSLAGQARLRWPLGPLLLAHRVGRLALGDAAVVVAAASPHRAEAFEACRFLIDAVKASVPIWKHERYADGGETWLGSPADAPPTEAGQTLFGTFQQAVKGKP